MRSVLSWQKISSSLEFGANLPSRFRPAPPAPWQSGERSSSHFRFLRPAAAGAFKATSLTSVMLSSWKNGQSNGHFPVVLFAFKFWLLQYPISLFPTPPLDWVWIMHCSNETPSQFEKECFLEGLSARSRASKEISNQCYWRADYEMLLVWHRCEMKKAACCTLLLWGAGSQITTYNLQFISGMPGKFFEGREGVGVRFSTYNCWTNSTCLQAYSIVSTLLVINFFQWEDLYNLQFTILVSNLQFLD